MTPIMQGWLEAALIVGIPTIISLFILGRSSNPNRFDDAMRQQREKL